MYPAPHFQPIITCWHHGLRDLDEKWTYLEQTSYLLGCDRLLGIGTLACTRDWKLKVVTNTSLWKILYWLLLIMYSNTRPLHPPRLALRRHGFSCVGASREPPSCYHRHSPRLPRLPRHRPPPVKAVSIWRPRSRNLRQKTGAEMVWERCIPKVLMLLRLTLPDGCSLKGRLIQQEKWHALRQISTSLV